jgi:hypothetical protein
MKYAVERGSGSMIYIKFHKDWFTHSKVGGGDTHRQHGGRISLLFLFIK